MLDPKAIMEELRKEGYKNLYTWCDPPGAFYDWHTHPEDEIRVVYKGSIVIGTEAGTRHWAKTQEGVCYVCGSR
jgi:quercetin dioxygenase-like cupin family protein